jgi:hypothetical protein
MKTSELTGAALDWAVAKCEGYEIVSMKGSKATFLDRRDDGALNDMEISYSTNWAQGGPIIEREMISLWPFDDVTWKAETARDAIVFEGETPLIAAMRCYVAAKLGDDIDVPEGLQ